MNEEPRKHFNLYYIFEEDKQKNMMPAQLYNALKMAVDECIKNET